MINVFLPGEEGGYFAYPDINLITVPYVKQFYHLDTPSTLLMKPPWKIIISK